MLSAKLLRNIPGRYQQSSSIHPLSFGCARIHKGERPSFFHCQEHLWRMTILRIGLMASIDVIFANRFLRLSSLRSASNKETCTKKQTCTSLKKTINYSIWICQCYFFKPCPSFLEKSLNIKTPTFWTFRDFSKLQLFVRCNLLWSCYLIKKRCVRFFWVS